MSRGDSEVYGNMYGNMGRWLAGMPASLRSWRTRCFKASRAAGVHSEAWSPPLILRRSVRCLDSDTSTSSDLRVGVGVGVGVGVRVIGSG